MNASPSMRRNPAISFALLFAIAAGVAWCFSIVISRRFAAGEVYVPCSTQRSDPRGSKALFEALGRLDGVTCERNYRRLEKLLDPAGDAESLGSASRRGETLVLLSLPNWAFEEGDAVDGEFIRDFAIAGGRVVLTTLGTLSPSSRVRESSEKRMRELQERRRNERKRDEKQDREANEKDAKTKPDTKERGPQDKKDSTEDDKESSRFRPAKSLLATISVRVKSDALGDVPENGHPVQTPDGATPVADKLPNWLSRASLNFQPGKPGEDKEDTADTKQASKGPAKDSSRTDGPAKEEEPIVTGPWQVRATVDGKPVLAERRFGHGSIVVATDSYFATNQALLMHPVPGFLTWLIGDARKVIFDETHLGTQENPGIMTLARRYRLHGFFLGGVLLFALFVWQSSSSLVPPRDDSLAGAARTVSGQGAVTGLVSLLRRGVSRSRLLQTCFEQWERNHLHAGPALQKRIEQARALLPPPGRRPSRGSLVVLYQRLCETLHPRPR